MGEEHRTRGELAGISRSARPAVGEINGHAGVVHGAHYLDAEGGEAGVYIQISAADCVAHFVGQLRDARAESVKLGYILDLAKVVGALEAENNADLVLAFQADEIIGPRHPQKI